MLHAAEHVLVLINISPPTVIKQTNVEDNKIEIDNDNDTVIKL